MFFSIARCTASCTVRSMLRAGRAEWRAACDRRCTVAGCPCCAMRLRDERLDVFGRRVLRGGRNGRSEDKAGCSQRACDRPHECLQMTGARKVECRLAAVNLLFYGVRLPSVQTSRSAWSRCSGVRAHGACGRTSPSAWWSSLARACSARPTSWFTVATSAVAALMTCATSASSLSSSSLAARSAGHVRLEDLVDFSSLLVRDPELRLGFRRRATTSSAPFWSRVGSGAAWLRLLRLVRLCRAVALVAFGATRPQRAPPGRARAARTQAGCPGHNCLTLLRMAILAVLRPGRTLCLPHV